MAIVISGRIRENLKKPLGRIYADIDQIDFSGVRIISIGDICTTNLLKKGITPHLAVFDFLFMRNKLFDDNKKLLMDKYPDPRRYANPPGTLSEELLGDAKKILKEGGAVLIEGEEDLTALAFILEAEEGDILIYGQPNEGVVALKPTKELKKKIKGWLASAASFGHEV